jgi:hypothetical protein
MATELASIRVRPLRFGFVVDPKAGNILRKVLQVNTCLWGGVYNYIIPAFKKTPVRYRERYLATPSAKNLINGLVEAFQPDFLVETTPGISKGIAFESGRIISLDALMATDDRGRRSYGIDLRSICVALYDESFRFVQRHAPKVLLPRAPSRRYELLIAATFGEIPESGEFADCRKHFMGALDAKEEFVQVHTFNKLFAPENLYPLRIGRHELETQRRGWTLDPMLFYMDEHSTYDIIEYWNLRAIGWRIRPLPRSWAPDLRKDCELFIEKVHRPYPPPSNAMHGASFLCSRSCSFEELQAFVSSLQKPSQAAVSIDRRVPRLWEEWGRHADHAEPQSVTYKTESVDMQTIGDSVSLQTIVPDFLELSPYGASEKACANVMEALPGGAPVIPWQTTDMQTLTGRFNDEDIWSGREGIITVAGDYRTHRFLRAPSPTNVFASWAEGHKLKLELSPAGRNTEQVVKSLGGLSGVRLLRHEKIIKLLDRMAHGDLELELPDGSPTTGKKRRIRTSAAPEALVRETLMRANNGSTYIAGNHLKALLKSKVLTLGMRLQCPKCEESTWYGISELDLTLTCGRCLRQFPFPEARPPKNAWAYRVIGPFAVENFAYGAYSVALAVQFLADKVAEACTWIPSFELKGTGLKDAEADFGMFLKPRWFSLLQDPLLVLGECKTFGPFESRDYSRMQTLAKLFPGAVICFCTLNTQLSSAEKKRITQIARAGRKRLKTGQQTNPVLVLTRTELFGQFKIGSFTDDYSGKFTGLARNLFMRGDVQEICDFTQQVHLGIESYHEWLEQRRESRKRKLSVKSQLVSKSPSDTP